MFLLIILLEESDNHGCFMTSNCEVLGEQIIQKLQSSEFLSVKTSLPKKKVNQLLYFVMLFILHQFFMLLLKV